MSIHPVGTSAQAPRVKYGVYTASKEVAHSESKSVPLAAADFLLDVQVRSFRRQASAKAGRNQSSSGTQRTPFRF